MGKETINQQFIDHLLKLRKEIISKSQKKAKDGNERVNYTLKDKEDNRYILYQRQNTHEGMEDDFSCGLSLVLASGEPFTLVRYNGPSHNHRNKLEKRQLGFVSHIHQAKIEYLEKTGKADGYAEKTNRYTSLEGALHCILEDCNISGLKANPDLPSLFD